MSFSDTDRGGVDVTMPETGAPGGARVAAWLRLPGEWVNEGEGLCLVEWGENLAELESPQTGVLRMLAVEAGREVPPGTTLARIETPAPVDETPAEPEIEPAPPEPIIETAWPEPDVEEAPPEPEVEEAAVEEPEAPVEELEAPVVPAAPVEVLEAPVVPEPEVESPPPPPAIVAESLYRDAPVAAPPDVELEGFLSPAVRRFVVEHDLDPRELAGSGRGGRVTLADVRAAAHRALSG